MPVTKVSKQKLHSDIVKTNTALELVRRCKTRFEKDSARLLATIGGSEFRDAHQFLLQTSVNIQAHHLAHAKQAVQNTVSEMEDILETSEQILRQRALYLLSEQNKLIEK